jgi:Glycosyl transferase 4-like domain
MRILFCNKYNFPFGGTEVYLLELMDLFRAHGHEVVLFSMADQRGATSPLEPYLVPPIDFKAPHGAWEKFQLAGHAIYSTDVRRRLGKLIADFQPDVAHVRNIYHHLSPSIFWELHARRVPVSLPLERFQSDLPYVQHGGPRTRLRAVPWRKVLARVDERVLFGTNRRIGGTRNGSVSSQVARDIFEVHRQDRHAQPLCIAQTCRERLGSQAN